ncbi:MAG: L-2-hydroxyglutarate oxidase [bacterium]|nr:L-2-hydroxyglutarate oxidase [bacterium]
MSDRYDVVVVGAGIVGLATARALTARLPGAALGVIEKEPAVATHQSGHNSGVLHTGLYYTPGSLRARLCVAGHRAMTEFCQEAGLPFRAGGKVVVATSEAQVPRLDELQRRGALNGVQGLRRVGPEELRELEPHASGVAALAVPQAAAVDFAAVARHIAAGLAAEVGTDAPLEAVEVVAEGVRLHAGGRSWQARLVLNCAGLHSDRVARLAGASPEVRIVPFRGEYYRLSEQAASLCRSLIYPVPDPAFPFLGVHFTRRVDGTVEVGPNAVLALGREHYRDRSPNLADVAEMLRFGGFWRLVARHWRAGSAEFWRSRIRRVYARSARALVPEVRGADLLAGGAGVRAQAVGADGRLLDDFCIQESPGFVHVLNAPSPAATASLAIGDHLADLAVRRLLA